MGRAALLCAAVTAPPAAADVITWGPVQDVTDVSQFSTNGALVTARNCWAQTFASPTVNGVPFSAFGPPGWTNGGWTLNAGSTTGDGEYDALLDSARVTSFGPGNSNPTGVGAFTRTSTDELYLLVTGSHAVPGSLLRPHVNAFQIREIAGDLGTNYCTANANSTGATGVMSAQGQGAAAANDLTLTASDLPPNQFGIFVTSRTQGFVPNAGGTSNGNLCLGGNLGRFSMPSQIQPTGAAGAFSLAIDLTAIPQGAGTVTVMAGDTWNFQAWHRDGVGLGSNFTDGLSITFQ